MKTFIVLMGILLQTQAWAEETHPFPYFTCTVSHPSFPSGRTAFVLREGSGNQYFLAALEASYALEIAVYEYQIQVRLKGPEGRQDPSPVTTMVASQIPFAPNTWHQLKVFYPEGNLENHVTVLCQALDRTPD